MGVVLDILVALIAIVGGILLLIALALVMPVRIGAGAFGDMRLNGGRGALRPFAGLLGIGVRVDRGTKQTPTPWRLVAGIMVWRLFVPLYGRVLEPDTTTTEDRQVTPTEPATPVAATPTPVAEPIDRGVSEPAAEAGQARPATLSESRAAPLEGHDRTPSEPRTETVVSPTPDDESPGTIDAALAMWREWSPVATGALRRLRGIVRIKRLAVTGTLGLNDPAITGQTVGTLLALRGLNSPRGFWARVGVNRGALSIDVEPEFDRMLLRGRVDAEVSISLRRVWSAGVFVGWKLFRRWRAERRAAAVGAPA